MKKTQIRIVAAVAAIALVLTALTFIPTSMPILAKTTQSAKGSKNSEIWDGKIASGFAGGSGSASNPYLISNGAQLAYLAQQVNSGNTYFSKYFKLTANICINKTDDLNLWYVGDYPANKWIPIGNEDNMFKGNFDGCGYAVRGLFFGDPKEPGMYRIGLFGAVDRATIANVGVEESNIFGGADIGSIVAYNRKGTITGCWNTGKVTGLSVGGIVYHNEGGTVSGCYNSGSIRGSWSAGGIVCDNDENGTVANCFNLSDLIGDDNNAGGIVGNNWGTVSKCYNTGNIEGGDIYRSTGGIVGENFKTGRIVNCYNTGEVYKSDGFSIGGIAGKNGMGGSIVNCYNVGKVTNRFGGGVIGENYGHENIISGCYYLDTCIPFLEGEASPSNNVGTKLSDAQLRDAANYEGFDFDEVWTMGGSPYYPYAELKGMPHSAESYPGSPDETFPPIPPNAGDGDVNGDGRTGVDDALIVMRYAMELFVDSAIDLEKADVDVNGTVNVADALIIMRIALQLTK